MKGQTLLLTLLFCVVSPKFRPYACIGERAFKLKMWEVHRETTDEVELVQNEHKSARECAKLCENFAFMFYISPSRLEKFNSTQEFNCICFHRKDHHLINSNPGACIQEEVKLIPLKIIPSDITAKPDSAPFQRCALDYGFMFSCQETETVNWCQDIDKHLDSFDYNQTYPKPGSLTFPQCMKRTDLKWEENGTIHTALVNGLLNCTETCKNGWVEDHRYYILHGDNC